jgi:hypothetical protein
MTSIDDLEIALSGRSAAIRKRSHGRARDRARVRRRRLDVKHSGLRIPMWRHSAFHPRHGQRILNVNDEERRIKVKWELKNCFCGYQDADATTRG